MIIYSQQILKYYFLGGKIMQFVSWILETVSRGLFAGGEGQAAGILKVISDAFASLGNISVIEFLNQLLGFPIV